MRLPSRQMPPVPTHSADWKSWIILGAALSGMLLAVVNIVIDHPIGAPIVIGALMASLLVMGCVADRRRQATMTQLAENRTGQSICEFARDFERRTVDTWILRAVYEQLQQELSLEDSQKPFPIRADDKLIDLLSDDDTLDLDLLPDIAWRTGRSLEHCDANPYFGRVSTVRDLVLFFEAQPKISRPAAA
ncbi:hypothetical protein [Chitiniphilus shinanonensis]|uniref:hypothetical protein n=1 Tax=Chitiniphilus shinanonensis TaxID=553088 RepID=UPI00302BB783